MSGSVAAPEGITNPPIDELLEQGRLQVRPGHLRRQARPPDQRLLLPARRGPARVRRPAGRDPRAGEAAVDRAARDQRRPADARAPRPDGRASVTLSPDRAVPLALAQARDRPRRRRRHRRLQGVRAAARCSPRPGHDVRVVPTGAALQLRRRGHLGGAVRAAGAHRRLGRRPRGAARADRPGGRPRASSPPPPPTCWPGPPTGCADDLLTNTLLTARCPVVFAPAMHTEMWEHPATAANVAHAARAAACVVLEPAVGPAHRRRHRQGPAARARGDLRGRPPACCAAGRRAAPTSPGAGSWSPPAAPASRSTRCASSATAPRGKQGYALARGRRGPRAPRSPWSRRNVGAARPGRGRPSSASGRPRELREAVLAAAADADAVVMAAAVADFRPGRRRAEPRSRRATTDAAPPIDAGPQPPTSSPSSSADRRAARPASSSGSPPRPATRRRLCSTTAGPSWPARAATCSSSTRSARAGPSRPTTTTAVVAGRRRRRAATVPARPEGRAGRRRSGTSWPRGCDPAVTHPLARRVRSAPSPGRRAAIDVTLAVDTPDT